jgi:UDPglucose 6-dehydrogenase
LALVQTARDYNSPVRLIETTVDVNDQRKKSLIKRVQKAAGGDLTGKTVGVLGLTFKPNTDDMRDSASLDLVPDMLNAGAVVKAFDPEGMKEAQKLLPDAVQYCGDAYEVMDKADVLVVLTEWNAFRSLNLERVKSLMNAPVIVDLRNIYDPKDMTAKGFAYSCIGRPVPSA